ncbi:hypothetical protein E1B28_005224 [Marasmius oreades]|uniref:Uncharacterized protein n=1 Tax=Marasmius oreades TaxID=181124 RepID=A0A9P7V089_9AGAR|nr:uncharacterized protein E1B28_005224 [Marasmius oreades]KAG7097913.1 hypothetical protein E1B28_005224 [Marasmius oreades]
MGLASCVSPLYIQELSPTRLQGRMVVSNPYAMVVSNPYAMVVSNPYAMVGLGAVPAAIQVVFLFVRVLVYLLEERTEEVDLKVNDNAFYISILSLTFSFPRSEASKLRSNEASTSPPTPPSSNVST